MPPESLPGLSPVERVKMLVATAAGVGYLPIVPGTFGSMVGVLLAWALATAGGIPAAGAGVIVVGLAGFWSAGTAERRLGRVDPGAVVIDEVAGQMLTLLLVRPTPAALFTGFVAFRILDIWKPGPIRRLEALPGGSGIMADDLAAGLLGCAGLLGAVWIFPRLLGSP